MQITVTQDHIDRGRKNSQLSCPISLALRDAGYRAPFVGGRSFFHGSFSDSNHPRREYSLPSEARTFVGAFDNGNNVQPFTFEVEGGSKA